MESRPKNIIALFDVDGTLTVPRMQAVPEVLEALKKLRQKIYIGVVGGSDLAKQKEQLGEDILNQVDYSFPENGILAYKEGKIFHSKSIADYLGNDNLKEFLNFCLHYIADLDIPIKRGTFIEFRTGLINVSPIGRNCSQAERDAFEKYDHEHKIREKMVKILQEKFASRFNLKFSIGGQISFDVFPIGWDKTYCLQHLDGFTEIHFFGDKTMPGGNDYEIFTSDKTIGHTVTTYKDTLKLLDELWLSK
jgi:phosphomannomutase